MVGTLAFSHVWLFVYPVSNTIQPSYPLLSLLLLPSTFSSIRISSSESVLHIGWPNIGVSAQHQSFQWIFRTDFLQLKYCLFNLTLTTAFSSRQYKILGGWNLKGEEGNWHGNGKAKFPKRMFAEPCRDNRT